MCQRIAESEPFRAARHVALYSARSWELELAPLEHVRPGQDVLFYYPRIEGTGLVFRLATTSTLRPGRFGIAEPPQAAPILPADTSVVILVPGLAFDRTGHRLGTGKGYYDRSLPEYPMAARIGVALDAFLEDRLPRDPWDVPMDAIATEREFLIVGPPAGVDAGDTEWT